METKDFSAILNFLTTAHASQVSATRVMLLSILREHEYKCMGSLGISLREVPFLFVGEIEARYREKSRCFEYRYEYNSIRQMLNVMHKDGLLRKQVDGNYVKYRLSLSGRTLVKNILAGGL